MAVSPTSDPQIKTLMRLLAAAVDPNIEIEDPDEEEEDSD